jgi:ABC-type lipoprotein release transport system permease subunit
MNADKVIKQIFIFLGIVIVLGIASVMFVFNGAQKSKADHIAEFNKMLAPEVEFKAWLKKEGVIQ